MSGDWTPHQEQVLIEAVGAGVSIPEIARHLGFGQRRVRFRYERLRRDGRIQPARKSDRGWVYATPTLPEVFGMLAGSRAYEAEFVADVEGDMRDGGLPLLEYALSVQASDISFSEVAELPDVEMSYFASWLPSDCFTVLL